MNDVDVFFRHKNNGRMFSVKKSLLKKMITNMYYFDDSINWRSDDVQELQALYCLRNSDLEPVIC